MKFTYPCIYLALCLHFSLCFPDSSWKTSPFAVPDSKIIMPSAIERDGVNIYIYTMVLSNLNQTMEIYQWNARPTIPVQTKYQTFFPSNPIENPRIFFLNNNIKVTYVDTSGPSYKDFIMRKSDLFPIGGSASTYQTFGIYFKRLDIFC